MGHATLGNLGSSLRWPGSGREAAGEAFPQLAHPPGLPRRRPPAHGQAPASPTLLAYPHPETSPWGLDDACTHLTFPAQLRPRP